VRSMGRKIQNKSQIKSELYSILILSKLEEGQSQLEAGQNELKQGQQEIRRELQYAWDDIKRFDKRLSNQEETFILKRMK